MSEYITHPGGSKLKLIIEQGSEKINSNGGLALVGAILATLDLEKRINLIKIGGVRNPIISNADVLKCYTSNH